MTTSLSLAADLDADQPAGWYLYRFDTDLRCALGPSCQMDHPLYLGKSNEPLRRLLEEARAEPWFRYVTGWRIDPQPYGSNGDVLAAEEEAIRAELPLANIHHNGSNRHRLDFGRPVPRQSQRVWAPRVRPAGRPRRSWTRRQQRAATGAVLVAVVWLTLVAVAWWWLGRHGLHGWPQVRAATVPASTAVVYGWSRTMRRRSLLRPLAVLLSLLGLAFSAYLCGPALLDEAQMHVPWLVHLLGQVWPGR